MKIVYNKKDGEIISAISHDQNHVRVYRDFNEDFVRGLDCLSIDEVPQPLNHYYISNDTHVIKHDSQSINEITRYGRVLTIDERLFNSLQPSYEEVKKAKMQIEILSTLQEVL